MPEEPEDQPAEEGELSEPETDSSSSQGIPEGRRVVRRKRKRGSSRETITLQQRDVLRELETEEPVVGVKQQVERLKAARRSEETGEPVEEIWGDAGPKDRSVRVVLLGAFAIAIPILAIVAAFMLVMKKDRDTGPEISDSLDLGKSEVEEVVLPYEAGSTIAWFNENPHVAYQSAVSILEALNGGEPKDWPEGVLRDQERALRHIQDRGSGWDSKFFTRDPRKLFWSTGESGETGFIALEGRREDFSKFRAYFIKSQEGLRMDWEATTGWCEVPYEEFLREPVARPFLVRCELGKEANYDTQLGEGQDLSWYLLGAADEAQFAWGWVRTRSDLDEKLRALLSYGRFGLEKLDSVRVILRVASTPGAKRASELEILDLLADEWVLP